MIRDEVAKKCYGIAIPPVVQWIEPETSKLLMGVRFPPGGHVNKVKSKIDITKDCFVGCELLGVARMTCVVK